MAAIAAAVADGNLTPSEAGELSKLVDAYVRAVGASDFDQRLRSNRGKRRCDAILSADCSTSRLRMPDRQPLKSGLLKTTETSLVLMVSASRVMPLIAADSAVLAA